MFNRAYSIITSKDDLTKENARIKQVLKESGCQETIISKIFVRITNSHSLSKSQQQSQATDIQGEENEYKFTTRWQNHINQIFYMLPKIWLSILLMQTILISHITELILIQVWKDYCFHPGPHMFFKY